MREGIRSGREVVGTAIDILSRELGEYISEHLDGRLATDDWTELLELKDAQEGRPAHPISPGDLMAQIRLMTTRFPEAGHLFDMDRAQQRYFGEIREARNGWAHGEEFVTEDAARVMDSMARLLTRLGRDNGARELRELAQRELLAIQVPEPEAPAPPAPTAVSESAIQLSTSEVSARGFDITVQHQPVLNFATIQAVLATAHAHGLGAPGLGSSSSSRGIISTVEIRSEVAETESFLVTVVLESAAGTLSEAAERIVDLAPGTTVLTDLDVVPDPAMFLGLDSRQSGTVVVRIVQGRSIVAERRSPIELLPANHWGGAGTPISAELLSAFVQPQHPVIAKLLSRAQDILQERHGRSAIAVFQQDDSDEAKIHVDQVVEAIYDAMAEWGIRYSNPPASWDVETQGGQRVRNAEEVLEGNVGTCLDTTVVLAAALEQAGINSVLWMVRGHAFLSYFRVEVGLRASSTEDFDVVSSLVEADVLRIVETTTVTAERRLPLDKASWGTLGRYVTGPQAAESFEIAVDVRMCRRAGIYPMPARTKRDDGTVTVTTYTPPQQDALQEYFRQKGEQAVSSKPARKSFPPRVEQWKNQLLDLSLRNRLLNFSDRARFPLGIPGQAVSVFEDLINSQKVIELLPADRVGAMDQEMHDDGFHLPAIRQQDLLLKESKVYTKVTEGPYQTALRKMAAAAKTERQESGANNLYLAIGSLVWSLGDKHQRSPLILVPVNLVSGGKGGHYRVELDTTGSSVPNFCLLEKLRQEFNLEIPGLEDPDADASGIDVEAAFAAVRQALVEANLPFHVEATVDLANLQFAKFRLWKDLDDHWAQFAENPLVHHLINTPAEDFNDPNADKSKSVATDLDELAARLPVPADASQLEAVAMAEAGRTFVLEGPPGTGKSQTITNLLASAMAQGKRVLFVAEKRAALEVVQQRLDAVGLGPFTLDLHDKGSRASDVRRQITESLDYKLYRDEQGRAALEADLRTNRRQLTRYATRLHEPNGTGLTAYGAHTQMLAIEEGIEALPVSARFAAQATIEEVNTVRRALDRLPDVADIASPAPVHPWGFVSRPADEEHIADAVRVADQMTDVLTTLSKTFLSPSVSTILERADAPALLAVIADVLAGGVAPGVLEEVRGAHWQQAVVDTLGEATATADQQEIIGTVFSESVLDWDLPKWITAADEADSGGFLGMGLKKRLIELARALQDGWTGTDEDSQRLPQLLREAQRLSDQVRALRLKLAGLTGLTISESWSPLGAGATTAVAEQAECLTRLADSHLRLVQEAPQVDVDAVETLLAGAHTTGIANGLRELGARWSELEGLTPGQIDARAWAHGTSFLRLWADTGVQRGTEWEGQRKLRAWNEFLTELEPLYDCLLFEARTMLMVGTYSADVARQGFEKGLALTSRRERLDTTGLSAFDARSHEKHIRAFTDRSSRMREHMRWWLPEQILQHRESSALLKGQRAGLLQRQISQSRKGGSVRRLMADYGDIITQAMPCTLVSPDSVARFFTAKPNQFDLVVFDEASQIRVADAIGAMGRGRAVVVVGDSKQMPPTSVAAIGNFDIDDDDLPEGMITDEESILSECEQARLPRLWLSWHYRSQDESLIAFSNHLYYDNKLASFPAPRFTRASPAVNGYGISLVRVNGHFHRTGEAGVPAAYRRTNPIEAEAIVEEIRRRFAASPDEVPSLGVVTLNLQQRALIEAKIRDDDDPRLAKSLDDMDGLFVKNLENVQGDERDTILFSTAFSPNDKGVLPLNFGPLNNPGGERRLNVAVTRARRQVVVFSSFDPAQLRAEASSSVGVKHLRSYLDLAATGPEAIPTTDALVQRIDRHREEIAAALRDRGYAVRTSVGLSEFQIDVSLASSEDPQSPVVAILLDGEDWAERKTVSDRDGLPKQVLENVLRWPVTHRVWLPQWITHPEEVCDDIERAFDRATEVLTGSVPADSGTNQSDESTDDPDVVVEANTESKESEELPRGAEPVSVESYASTPSTPDEEHTSAPTHEYPSEEPDDDQRRFFEGWPVREVGDLSELESLKTAETTRKVREVAAEIVELEWPIKKERLARLINNAFGLRRVSQPRAAAVLHRLDRHAFTTDQHGFLWPATIDPETWFNFRRFHPTDEVPVTDISPWEISNAMAQQARVDGPMDDAQLRETMKSHFGFSRMGQHVRARLDEAIELGLANGRLTRADGALIASGQKVS